jgi:hypothetical protein
MSNESVFGRAAHRDGGWRRPLRWFVDLTGPACDGFNEQIFGADEQVSEGGQSD